MPTIIKMRLAVVATLCILTSLTVSAKNIAPSQFAEEINYQGARISPDGKHIAVRLFKDGKGRILVLTINGFKAVGNIYFQGNQEPGSYYWVNNERLVIKLLESEPWEESPKYYGELFAVNYDGSDPEMIYGYRAGEKETGTRLKRKESVRGWANIIDYLSDDKEHILISSQRWSEDGSAHATVHKLNVYSGKMGKKLLRSPVPAANFVTDEGQVKLVVGLNEKGEREVFTWDAEKEDWNTLPAHSFGDKFYPLTLNASGKKLYVYDNGDKDTAGLYTFDLETAQMSHVYSEENVDISRFEFSADRSHAYAMRVDDGRPAYLMFGKKSEEAKLFKRLLSTFPGNQVAITSSTADDRYWVIFVSSDISIGSYYLFDSQEQQLSQLFANFDHLDTAKMSESLPINFKASDGESIPGYLTYPNGVKKRKKVPLVVLVHGGPHGVRDYWYFNREVQMLAAQGYAVLRVNYRGSGGYGMAFEKSGHEHWGDRIQQDIIEGTQWAIEQGRINKKKVCIMGTSFGGYSALQASILAPDLFKCAVANAGVYDLPMLLEDGANVETFFGEEVIGTFLGDDENVLKAFSPVNHVDKLKAAVFIAHGEKDRVAPIEHAEKLRDALKQHDKEFEWFVKSSEGHGFYSKENRSAFYEAAADFLDEHLD